jgi:hypothetical protein
MFVYSTSIIINATMPCLFILPQSLSMPCLFILPRSLSMPCLFILPRSLSMPQCHVCLLYKCENLATRSSVHMRAYMTRDCFYQKQMSPPAPQIDGITTKCSTINVLAKLEEKA